jgi:predicted permease
MSHGPPYVLRRLLAWILPPGCVRDGLLGDLDELYAERSTSRLLADMWYARQVLSATWRYVIPGYRWEEVWRMDTVKNDLATALRAWRRAPAFYLGTALLMALGIGSVSATFAIFDHLFLRPLPYPQAERLVTVDGSQSYPAFVDFDQMRSVEAWSAVAVDDAHLTGVGEPLRISQARIAGAFFEILGAHAVLGRVLSSAERDTDVAVLSHGAWVRIWGANDGVPGRVVHLDGGPVVVVGVLSDSFVPPEALLDGAVPDVWRPIDASRPEAADRASRSLVAVGRLTAGATLDDLRSEASDLARRRASAFPEVYTRRDGSAVDLSVADLHEATVGNARERLRLLFAAVALLLLVSCLNVAHLFIARGMTQYRESAVRRALGAPALRIARRVLFEGVLVSLAGGAAGVVVASLALKALLILDPVSMPRASAIALDARVLAFTTALAAATAVCFGVIPSMRAIRVDPAAALRSGGRSQTGHPRERSTREALMIAEVALSFLLVFHACLLTRSFLRMNGEPLGFRVEDVWTVRIGLDGGADGEPWQDRMARLAEAVGDASGVRSVTYGLSAPLEHVGGTCCWSRTVVPGDGRATVTAVDAAIHPYDPQWVDVLEPAVLAGESWTAAARRTPVPPALLNRALARQLFGSVEAALGQHVDIGAARHDVVGVVADSRHYGPERDAGPALYVPIERVPFTPDRLTLVVRMNPGLDDVPVRLRRAIWDVEPLLPLPTVRSMDDWAGRAMAKARFDGWLFGAFAGAALLLAGAGIGGALMYRVRNDTRALGIRLALGASRRSVEARVLGRGLGTTGAGLLIGTVLALTTRPLVESRLFGIAPTDTTTLLGAAAVLMSTAAVASWLPAHRAGAVDPVETLRRD